MVDVALTEISCTELMDKIFGVSRAISSDALKKMQKYKYTISDANSKIIYSKLRSLSPTQVDGDLLTILKLVRMMQLNKCSSSNLKYVIDISFKGLESTNGNIRECSRNIIENLFRYEGVRPKSLQTRDNNNQSVYIKRVEDLISKYRPEKPPSQLDGLKPSVFKTLAMCWHGLMMRYESDDELYWERADAIGVPEYSVEDDLQDGRYLTNSIPRACEYPELQPYLARPIPSIKLEYFTTPTHAERAELASKSDYICAKCKKAIVVMGSFNKFTQQSICDTCAIDDYMVYEGFKTIEAAAAHRRRLFDVGYLFTEMLIDRYLKAYGISSEDELSEAERQDVFHVSNELQEMMNRDTIISLQNEPSQAKIERFYNKLFDSIRVFE